jgi:ABC-type transport system involved in multi-copper enzyme maturation permease subunit
MMSALHLGMNPILVKELRSRMRGGRAFAVLTIALAILAAFSYALYRLVIATADNNPAPISPQVGQVMFAGLAYIELIIIAAITPSITASAVSEEIEKLTYEMLLATPLHPARVLSGKLIAALSYIFLLIFAAIPLASLIFVFGGVALRDMVKALAVLTVTATTIGVLGLFFSALFRRSGRAIVTTYLVVALVSFGPIAIYGAHSLINQMQVPPRWLLVPSPLSALTSAISPSIDYQTIASRFWMFSVPWGSLDPRTISLTSIPRPIYHYTLPLYGALALLLYIIATRLVLPIHRWRIRLGEALVGLVLVLGYLALVGTGFYMTTHRYENIQIIPPAGQSSPNEVIPATEAPAAEKGSGLAPLPFQSGDPAA